MVVIDIAVVAALAIGGISVAVIVWTLASVGVGAAENRFRPSFQLG
jgi:hypothetical protein